MIRPSHPFLESAIILVSFHAQAWRVVCECAVIVPSI